MAATPLTPPNTCWPPHSAYRISGTRVDDICVAVGIGERGTCHLRRSFGIERRARHVARAPDRDALARDRSVHRVHSRSSRDAGRGSSGPRSAQSGRQRADDACRFRGQRSRQDAVQEGASTRNDRSGPGAHAGRAAFRAAFEGAAWSGRCRRAITCAHCRRAPEGTRSDRHRPCGTRTRRHSRP